MYVGDGVYPGVKFVLVIYTDNSLKLLYYNGRTRIEEPGVEIVDSGENGGKRIEYGTPNVKTSLPFKKYLDGTLEERWTKIK